MAKKKKSPRNKNKPSKPKKKKKKNKSHKWVRYEICAELLSDAHLGTGSGGGGVDALVARDRQGNPVIWASHLKGVLRDAARRLQRQGEACCFFGKPAGKRQKAVFTSLYTEENPESRIWRSTARQSYDNRAPMDDTLRAIEHVPKGTVFKGQVECLHDDVGFLQLLFQEVDALGSGRATGTGRVKLTLTEKSVASPPLQDATGRLVILLKTLDPLCITANTTLDNLIPSHSFVPGRSLLGAFASWLFEEKQLDAASLLTEGKISVSDALPLPSKPSTLETAEVLPAPLTLQRKKPAGSTTPLPWWAQAGSSPERLDTNSKDAEQLREEGVKLKRPEDDLFVYRAAQNEPWTTYRPALRVRLRNGRPIQGQADPELFAIEQIVENTYFLCELRGEKKDMKQLTEQLQPVLEGSRWIRIGRGGAPVEVATYQWCKNSSPTDEEHTSNLTQRLTLTSDLLARDELLRWRTSIDKEALEQIPGWPEGVKVVKDLQDTVPVRGFNGTARLWRMPSVAVRRGSVFEVKSDDPKKLSELAANGQWLGERTHEGFGRFRIDSSLPGVTEGKTKQIDDVKPDSPDEAVARETKSWLEDHHPELKKPSSGSERKPSLSQWFDLLSSIERGNPAAFEDRLDPQTASAKCWEHKDAKSILKLLKEKHKDERAAYARLFTRWLRVALRKERV